MEAGLPIIKPERAARTVKVGPATSSAVCQWRNTIQHEFHMWAPLLWLQAKPSGPQRQSARLQGTAAPYQGLKDDDGTVEDHSGAKCAAAHLPILAKSRAVK